MANTTQPKLKPSTQSGFEAEEPYRTETARPVAPVTKTGSSTAIMIAVAVAIVAALAYFLMPVTSTNPVATPQTTTQDSAPTAPVPADPPAAPVGDAPAPVPTAPAPATP